MMIQVIGNNWSNFYYELFYEALLQSAVFGGAYNPGLHVV